MSSKRMPPERVGARRLRFTRRSRHHYRNTCSTQQHDPKGRTQSVETSSPRTSRQRDHPRASHPTQRRPRHRRCRQRRGRVLLSEICGRGLLTSRAKNSARERRSSRGDAAQFPTCPTGEVSTRFPSFANHIAEHMPRTSNYPGDARDPPQGEAPPPPHDRPTRGVGPVSPRL